MHTTTLYPQPYTKRTGAKRRILDLYLLKGYFTQFLSQNSKFRRLFEVSSPKKTCILNSNTLIRTSQEKSWGLSLLLLVGEQSRNFACLILRLIEPFYLTVDKTARLALIEPLNKVDSSLLSPSAVRSHRAIKKEEPSTKMRLCWFFKSATVSRLPYAFQVSPH